MGDKDRGEPAGRTGRPRQRPVNDGAGCFRAIFEEGPLGVAVVGRDCRIEQVNSTLCRILGRHHEELIGRAVADITHPDDRTLTEELSRQILRDEIPYFQVDQRCLDRDGHPLWVRLTASAVRDEEGRPRYGLAMIEDIRGRRAAPERQERLEEQLRQSQKLEAVGQLAGGVAHDFNNLLTAILGNVELAESILRRGGPPDDMCSALNEVRSAAKRAGSLTQQLLNFARKRPAQPQVIDIAEIVTGIESMLARLLGERVTLRVRTCETGAPVLADASEIELVLLNLAVNARDAMPRGGELTLDVSRVTLDDDWVREHPGARAGDHVRLIVADDGAGMPGEVLDKIYEPFFTTKPLGEGTGLGLATVVRIVSAAGGHMTVESQPRRGTRFAIYLPLTDGSRRTADDISTQPARGKELVLVCEDDAAVRAVSVQVLRAYGYKVLEAEHGVRALELLRAQPEPVDLVVTDVVMPGMSGNELARRIARQHPTVRVLFVSGYLPGGSEEEAALESSPGLLRKPFTANQLLRRVRRCLDVPMGSISRPKHRRRSRASDKSDKAGRGPDPMV